MQPYQHSTDWNTPQSSVQIECHLQFAFCLNPFEDGGQKRPLIPVTSTNVRISLKSFLTFSFNPFATLVQNFKAEPSAGPKLLKDFSIFLVKSL